MDIHNLAARLRDPNPQIRVETLRILAMVEETRALDAIRWIYRNDPEEGVRQVADWAGRAIWAAEKRGHSTQKAVQEMFSQPLSPEKEAMFLAAMEKIGMPFFKKHAAERYAADQGFRRLMDETMRDTKVPAPRQLPPGNTAGVTGDAAFDERATAVSDGNATDEVNEVFSDLFPDRDLDEPFDDDVGSGTDD